MPAVLSKNAKNVLARAKVLYLCRAGFGIVELQVNALQLCVARIHANFIDIVEKADLDQDATDILMCEKLSEEEVNELRKQMQGWAKKGEKKVC